MNSRQIAQRLQAWKAGKPLPRGETMHFPIAPPEDTLILAFVRMGGESSPWGVACGHPGQKPMVLTVPEARNRDLVADLAASLASALLPHFQPCGPDGEPVSGPDDHWPLRQIWLPNPTHLDMLHFMAYSYTFTKWGSKARVELLNALGRVCGWLHREAYRPGQVTLMTATEALRESYTFPAEDARQAHLGFLLAWLQTRGNRSARLKAAQAAERKPIATSIDPELERESLQPLVEKWNEAWAEKKPRVMQQTGKQIHQLLERELLKRYQLVERVVFALQNDKRRLNSGVALLERESLREHWYQYLRNELQLSDPIDGPAFIPSPETDRYSAAAASRYFVHEASEDFRISALIHDDREMQEEVLAAGEGITGEIVGVRDEGKGRGTTPVWVIETRDDVPLRVREGSWLCVAGLPSRTVEVRSIKRTRPGILSVEVEIRALKTRPRKDHEGRVPLATDHRLENQTVTLLPSSAERISRMKGQKVWNKDLPGSWLTHARPHGRAAKLPKEVSEEAPG